MLNFACDLSIFPHSKPPAPLVRPLMPAAVPALLPASICPFTLAVPLLHIVAIDAKYLFLYLFI